MKTFKPYFHKMLNGEFINLSQVLAVRYSYVDCLIQFDTENSSLEYKYKSDSSLLQEQVAISKALPGFTVVDELLIVRASHVIATRVHGGQIGFILTSGETTYSKAYETDEKALEAMDKFPQQVIKATFK